MASLLYLYGYIYNYAFCFITRTRIYIPRIVYIIIYPKLRCILTKILIVIIIISPFFVSMQVAEFVEDGLMESTVGESSPAKIATTN